MGAWPLKGRSQVLEDLRTAVDEGNSAVIAGPPGVGKTRLARDLSTGREVRWAAATRALEPIPFGAFAHLLDDGDWLAPEDLLAALRSAAGSVERSGADLVVIDDLRLLDDRSLALVDHLLQRRSVTVVATVRDRADARPEFQALWKDGRVALIDLGPLTRPDVAELLPEVLGGPVEQAAVDHLHQLTSGNPLLLRETVRSGLADGSLERRGPAWAWTGVHHPSPGLLEAVRSRFAPLGPRAIAAADLLALGEPLPVQVLRGLTDPGAVESMEAAGVVVVDPRDDLARFVHPLYGEVVASALGATRRQRLSGDLAETLEPSATTPTERLRVARWRLASGEPWPASRWAQAATEANSRFAHALAEALARRSVEAGGGFDAQLALASALVGLRRFDEANDVLDFIEGTAASDDQHVEIAVARFHAQLAAHGFRSRSATDMARVEAQVHDPDRRAFLAAQRATLLCFGGELEAGTRVIDAVLADLGARDDPAAMAVRLRLCVPQGTVGNMTGRTREPADLCAALVGPAIELRNEVPGAAAWSATTWLTSLLVGYHLDEATTSLGLLRSFVHDGGWSPEFVQQAEEVLTRLEGQLWAQRGDVPRALGALRPLATGASTNPLASLFLTEAAAAAGEEVLAGAAADALEASVSTWPVYREVARLGRAWALAATGRTTDAAAMAHDAALTAEGRGHHTSAIYAAHTAARLGRAHEVAADLRPLVPLVDLAVAPALDAHVSALDAGDGDGLDAAAASFEVIGTLLPAAEAAASAAAAHRANGRAQAASRSKARAAALLDRCGGVRPPWMAPVDAPVPLTRREREVVELACRGLTSSDIGERLFVSTRTVEGHLLRAYQKLGVRNREELGRAVGPAPATH